MGKRFTFSAASGTTNDVVMAGTDFVGGHTYVAVKGANGAFSTTQPYTLQVETSLPTETLETLNAGITPSPTPIVSGGGTTPVSECSPSPGVKPLTLFVTQAQRIDALYGDGTNDPTAQGQPFEFLLRDELQTVCNDPKVAGEVISVPASYYTDWDKKPWDPQLANDVAQQIRDNVIDHYLQQHDSIKYVVLVGSDEVIPQRRVPDGTVLGNEREYVQDSYLNANSPELASLFDSMVLTDDYYADTKPIADGGHDLYIPDLAISRLVEKPAEIFKTLDIFESQGGYLKGGTSVVTGQDWMTNGAQRVTDALTAAGLTPTVEPFDTWHGDDVRRDVLGVTPSPSPSPSPQIADVANVNAHFSHYGGISAYGHGQAANDPTWWDPSEFLSSVEIAKAKSYEGKLLFTLGCHAGLSVPDDQVVPMDLGTDPAIDPRLDVAQAMGQQGGVLVGSTGYGFGDTVTVTGTEALMGTFADQATTADDASHPSTNDTPVTGQPVGLALAAAKRAYLGSLTTVSPYDEKSCVQLSMYGMPQYRLECPTPHDPVAAGLDAASGNGPATAGLKMGVRLAATDQSVTAPQSFTLNIVDGDTPLRPITVNLDAHSGTGTYADGTYYAATNDASVNPSVQADCQATVDRPVQPRVVVNLGSGGVDPVRAIVVTGGSYTDLPDFNPAISRVTNDCEQNVEEFQVSSDGWWPSDPATVTTITGTTNDGTEQRLVVLPGQFQATTAVGDPLSGTERLWGSLTVRLIRGPVPTADTDNIAPTVHSVTLTNDDDAWTVHVDAQDAGRIDDITVTQIGAGDAQSFDDPISPAAASGSFDAPFTLADLSTSDVSVMVSVTDVAGNVTTATAKGRLITAPPEGSMTINGGAAVTYTPLVTVDSAVVHAHELRASTDHTNWSDWMPYRAKVVVNLPGLPGDKTIWVQYRNADPTVLELSGSIRQAASPVAAGDDDSLVLKSDGSVWSWGYNSFGQLGDGSTADQHSPAQVAGLANVTSVATHGEHTMALAADGTLWGWGWNGRGTLGDGTWNDHHSPTAVGTGTVVAAPGGNHTLVLRADGSLWASGSNMDGCLGDGTMTERESPVRIGSDTDWTAISAGTLHSLALKADGSLWAWGYNAYGQLGDGTATDRWAPVRIGTDVDWVAIAAGGAHSLALKSDGTLWAWGWNAHGQLGDGTTTDRSTPVQVGDETDWTAIAAGGTHCLALKADGTLWAWGWNLYGQVGDGTSGYDRTSPVRVGNASDWAAIAAGTYHSLAVESDGRLWAWGRNWRGALGDGTLVERNSPTQVGAAAWIDITPPTVSIGSPAGRGLVTTATPQLTYNVGDAVPASVVVKVDGSAVGTTSGQNLDALTNGQHTVTVSGTDAAGNTGTANSTFTVAAFVGNTQLGLNVTVQPGAGTSVIFSQVIVAGQTTATTTLVNPGPALVGTQVDQFYSIGTTAGHSGSISVTLPYTPGALTMGQQQGLKVEELIGNVWTDVTTAVDTTGHTVTGSVTQLGTFAIVAPNPPTGTMTLNNGNTTSYTTVVTLDSSQVTGAVDMRTSTDHTNWTPWRPYAASSLVDLPGLPGAKTVWAEYRGATLDVLELHESTSVAVAHFAAGGYHSLALKADGSLYDWGYNAYGQLGDGTTTDQHGAELIGTGYVAIAAGNGDTLALKADGSLYAWGWNSFGQLGDGTTTDQHGAEQIGTGYVAIAAGTFHTLALKTDGSLYAWGHNDHGQLGDGTTTDRHDPELIGTGYVAIAAGGYHSLALKADGTLYGWGDNTYGQLGDGTTTDQLSPESIGTGYAAVATGYLHSLALKADGSLYAWGENGDGQLGDGTTARQHNPKQIGTGYAAIAAGSLYSLALKTDGSLYAWGNNDNGQLGDGTTTGQLSPESIGTDCAAIAAGTSHSLALKTDGSLCAWGRNDFGQLGDGTTADSLVPKHVFDLNDTTPPSGTMALNNGNATAYAPVVALDSSAVSGAAQMRTTTDDTNWTLWRPFAAHTLVNLPGLPGTKTVRAQYRDWGHNVLELNGSTSLAAQQFAAGGSYSLGLKADGSLYSWGWNAFGQLGDGTTTQHVIPEPIGAGYAAIAAGSGHDLALKTDGSLYAWGWNYYGQLGDGTTTDEHSAELVGPDYVAVSAGNSHTLALTADGSLYSWGDNTYGQLGDGTTASHHSRELIGAGYIAIAAAGEHSLALKADGSLYGWGNNFYGQLGDGTTTDQYSPELIGTDYAGIAAAGEHSLALKADGSLYAWGANYYGQLGDGTTTDRHSPTLIGTAYADVAAGMNHSLALKSDGSLYAWGRNTYGQLGDGGTTNQDGPELIGAGFAAVSAGAYHSLALKADGGLFAWGYNSNGQLGDGTTANSLVPEQIFDLSDTTPPSGTMALNNGNATAYTPAVALDSSAVSGATALRTSTNGTTWTAWRRVSAHGVAALGGLPGSKTLYVQYHDWGYNTLQLSASVSLAPVPVSAGGYHTLASTSTGKLIAWGWNFYGQLGDNTTTEEDAPLQIGTGTFWDAVSAGNYYSAARRSDGTLWAWGDNYYGQLGDGSTTDRHVPTQIGTDAHWAAVSVGDAQSLAVKSDGTLWAWGWNHYGQLGDGSTTDRHAPAQIGTDTHWVAVGAGSDYSLALKSDGTLWAWGRNNYGQLGDNTTTDKQVPAQIGTDADWAGVSAGYGHSLALKTDGSLWAWGDNTYGELGDNTTTSCLIPTQVDAGTQWLGVSSASGYHSLAIRSDGTLWAWGYNNLGEVGDNTAIDRHVPTQIDAGTGWAAVSGGSFYSIALENDGSIWAWGSNNRGQLGDGTTTNSLIPKSVSTR